MAAVLGSKDNYLVISDLQIPFEAAGALSFCKRLQKEFRIPEDNILCVGDETDQYFGGLWKKSPEAKHTPESEISETIEKLKEWYSSFPKMKLAISNHGTRWARKAFFAEIPSQLIREYREVLQAPKSWIWQQSWLFKNIKHPFRMIHGMGYSGKDGHRNAAMDAGISTIIGHLHSFAAIDYIVTDHLNIWAANSGSLINFETYAFEYAREARHKPTIGTSVILDSGRMPIWVPYED